MHLPLNTRPKTAAVLAGTAVLAAAGFVSGRLRTRAAETRSPPAGRMLEVEGARLHVLQHGSGPDVLLIHGMAMMAAEMMLALGKAFPGQRVTAIDRPAHGHSGKRRRPSLDRQVELLHAAVVELGLKTPVVVGHSLGGAVALAYGERFPDEVSGVVAVAPLAYPGWGPAHIGRAIRGAPVLGPLLSNTTLALADPAVMRAAVPMIFSPQKAPEGFREAVDVDLLARPSAMVADGADFTRASFAVAGLSKRYGRYPVPVHVVLGDKDPILKPARQGLRLAKAMPAARLTVRSGLGHMVHHFAPEAVAVAVADVRTRSLGVHARAAAA
jgi:pimeloyl-ACP methyl ester carboxylesterase